MQHDQTRRTTKSRAEGPRQARPGTGGDDLASSGRRRLFQSPSALAGLGLTEHGFKSLFGAHELELAANNHRKGRDSVSGPLNQCSACGEDFASLAAFDAHILSKPSDSFFDCLFVSELKAARWTQNDRGRWTSPKLKAGAEKLKEHHQRASSERSKGTGGRKLALGIGSLSGTSTGRSISAWTFRCPGCGVRSRCQYLAAASARAHRCDRAERRPVAHSSRVPISSPSLHAPRPGP
jgi:hypothetical protein